MPYKAEITGFGENKTLPEVKRAILLRVELRSLAEFELFKKFVAEGNNKLNVEISIDEEKSFRSQKKEDSFKALQNMAEALSNAAKLEQPGEIESQLASLTPLLQSLGFVMKKKDQ